MNCQFNLHKFLSEQTLKIQKQIYLRGASLFANKEINLNKPKLKYSEIETDVQSLLTDKNTSLACLSLTDEGSAFIKNTKLVQVEQSQITINYPSVQNTTDFKI